MPQHDPNQRGAVIDHPRPSQSGHLNPHRGHRQLIGHVIVTLLLVIVAVTVIWLSLF